MTNLTNSFDGKSYGYLVDLTDSELQTLLNVMMNATANPANDRLIMKLASARAKIQEAMQSR